jgi:hypothetical protein
MNDNLSKDRRIDLLKNLISKLSAIDVESEGPFIGHSLKGIPETVAPQGFSIIEVAAVASFVKSIEESGEELRLRFEPSSGALLWKDSVLEVAKPGFLQVLSKIAGTETRQWYLIHREQLNTRPLLDATRWAEAACAGQLWLPRCGFSQQLFLLVSLRNWMTASN